ncbi:WXG100 family type VII secretion target [Streptomyces sp. NPDC046915]|uniref:WXG100 family type VII secretion target n=1 Tax=Streptomyces sp. NPDC046915 TaxID=3155257 RepID=UPI003408CADC
MSHDGQHVGVDGEAHAASRKFLSIIHGGLSESINQLASAGNTLSDRSHWSGRYADEFRQAWQGAQTDLQKIRQSLQEFQHRFDKVLNDISTAGGNH